MKSCNKCQVEILDGSITCPLCKAVLDSKGSIEMGYGYPVVAFNSNRYYLLNKILLFVSLLIIITSVVVNYVLYNGILWSLVSITSVLFLWIAMRHAIRNGIDLATKIIVQVITGSILVVIIDGVMGFTGWSVNYVIPQLATLANIGILVLLIVSKLEFKRYVLHQLGMAFVGFVPIILLMLGIVTRPLMTYIAAATSLVIVLFTVIFGDKSLKSELIRRFHI